MRLVDRDQAERGDAGKAAEPLGRGAFRRDIKQVERAGPDAPFSQPGTDVKISWTVTGAPGAAVAVDDPSRYGAYGRDYPASGSLELAFPCDAAGTTEHTYTVWPAGAEGSPRSITVSARAGG